MLVAWPMPDRSWNGGVNYFKNLQAGLALLPGRRFDPVFWGHIKELPDSLIGSPCIEAGLDQASSAIFRGLRRGLLLAGQSPKWVSGWVVPALRERGVVAMTHTFPWGCGEKFPSLSWIPDFQHLHLPLNFPLVERKRRMAYDRILCRHAERLIVSSESARVDLDGFFPGASSRARVLRFVAAVDGDDSKDDAVLLRLGIQRGFYHLPNQLWKHKNHQIVLEAMQILKDRGRRVPAVICTGSLEDPRNPEYGGKFQDEVSALGFSDQLRILGPVRYGDVMALMRCSLAVINPSTFEGWSSTVEEAKSLGKRVLLSDIPVHREQDPDRCVYFPADDPGALADLIDAWSEDFDPLLEQRERKRAESELPERLRAFARSYQDMVLEALAI